MAVWQGIWFAIVQGITEFLPISSFGHLILLEQITPDSIENMGLFSALLHVGTLMAVAVFFIEDIKRLFSEFVYMLIDGYDNLKIWFNNRKFEDEKRYHKLLSNNYRRFAVFLIISTCFLVVVRCFIQEMVVAASNNLLACGIGFFITAIILLVTECTPGKREKTPRETRIYEAILLGLLLGLSALPGISQIGMGLCVCFLFGYGNKYAMKYSYLLMVPISLSNAVVELTGSKISGGAPGVITCILAMLVAGVVGYFCIGFSISLIRRKRLRFFSVYCMIIGVISIVVHFLLTR